MKKLTYSSMALARLRANKRQYLSLVLGIFLAIFLVTAVFLSAQGFLLAQVEQTEQKTGALDAFFLDDPDVSDEMLLKFDKIRQIGHAYVTATLEGTEICLGWYDEAGIEHVAPELLEGRFPKTAGEIAVEQGTLLSLDMERDWQVGDTLELSLNPIDGKPETRSFTLVGILTDRAANLVDSQGIYVTISGEYVKYFPALLTSGQDAPFQSGRVAVHRTFLLSSGKWGNPCVNQFHRIVKGSYDRFYCISPFGYIGCSDEIWQTVFSYDAVVIPLLVGALLALALTISCCVGIAGAMEGALARRGEEIGLLRAVGATKRQIRRIFGRESLLLAALVAPGSILMAIGTVGLISWAAPKQMVLKIEPLLLVPIAAVSVIMILLSGHLPLRRYAKLMPMSVIRDTAVLRRHKHIRSKKQFRVPALISGRLLRLYPSRQVGSTVLTALMLFCAVCSVFCFSVGTMDMNADTAAFQIMIPNTTSTGYVKFLPNKPLSGQSIAQIKMLPHVTDVRIERSVDILVLLDKKSDYLKSENPAFYTQEEYLERLSSKTAALPQDLVDATMESWRRGVEEYDQVRAYLGVKQEMVKLRISTLVLDESTLLKLSGWVEAGRINVEAINAGREVIVTAPSWWEGEDSQGRGYGYSDPVQRNPQDVMTAKNDCFYPGQMLPMIQLYNETETYTENFGLEAATRLDTSVTVGAVLNQYDGAAWHRAMILTTEKGLQNMGLYANGYDYYHIYLDGDIDASTEELLTQHLEAIARKSGEYRFTNMLQKARENNASRSQLITVFAAIAILFAAVSVSMIVSSVTRRLQSDGRRIGMLRAVGADGKTILGCYSGQISASILGGFLLTTAVLIVILMSGAIDGKEAYLTYGFAVMAALALLSWVTCRYILRLRIRNIINKSIIDNIREL